MARALGRVTSRACWRGRSARERRASRGLGRSRRVPCSAMALVGKGTSARCACGSAETRRTPTQSGRLGRTKPWVPLKPTGMAAPGGSSALEAGRVYGGFLPTWHLGLLPPPPCNSFGLPGAGESFPTALAPCANLRSLVTALHLPEQREGRTVPSTTRGPGAGGVVGGGFLQGCEFRYRFHRGKGGKGCTFLPLLAHCPIAVVPSPINAHAKVPRALWRCCAAGGCPTVTPQNDVHAHWHFLGRLWAPGSTEQPQCSFIHQQNTSAENAFWAPFPPLPEDLTPM